MFFNTKDFYDNNAISFLCIIYVIILIIIGFKDND
jgi:hypothetical protein